MVTLNGVPVTAEVGRLLNDRLVAGAGLTLMDGAIEALTVAVSAAMMDLVPAVLRVARKNPKPEVNVVSAGNTACGSTLLKCTVPV